MPKQLHCDMGQGDGECTLWPSMGQPNKWMTNYAKLLGAYSAGLTPGATDDANTDIYLFRDSNSILCYTGFDVNTLTGTGTQLFN